MKQEYRLTAGVNARLPQLDGTAPLREASADDLRVLLALALSDYRGTVDEMAKATGISLTRAAAAVEYWLGAGVIAPVTSEYLPSDDLPKGSAADDARFIGEHRLQECLDTCAHILGKMLNPAEINILVAVLNELDVGELYLIILLDFCVNRLHVRGVKYLERTAKSLCDRGIRTPDALDAYIKRYEAAHSHEGEIRRLYGFGDRTLTEKERDILEKWFGVRRYDQEVIAIAYDLTVNSAKRVTLSYTDRILEEWYRQGVKTPGEVEAYLAARRENAPKPRGRQGGGRPALKQPASFDTGNFFEAALNRLQITPDKPSGAEGGQDGKPQ